jgi:hypothetical protein
MEGKMVVLWARNILDENGEVTQFFAMVEDISLQEKVR